jgi:hypothetical protein
MTTNARPPEPSRGMHARGGCLDGDRDLGRGGGVGVDQVRDACGRDRQTQRLWQVQCATSRESNSSPRGAE